MSKSGKKEPSKIVQAYLIGYNAIEAVGWTYLLYQFVIYHLTSPTKSLYDTIKCPLIIFQNAAVLEIVHASTGMVSSNPLITTFQVLSRVVLVCGMLMGTLAARESIGLPLCILAWSVTEIIRYSTYTLTLTGSVPYFLKWLRYTLFIVLYPIGITGELLCIYAAQKEIGAGNMYSITMPNKYNFIFNCQYLLFFNMFMYIPHLFVTFENIYLHQRYYQTNPLFPRLYLHMFSQRRKVLGGPQKEK